MLIMYACMCVHVFCVCMQMLHEITPLSSPAMHARLLKLGNPFKTLQRMHELIKDICRELNERIATSSPTPAGIDPMKDDIQEMNEEEGGEKEEKEENDEPETVVSAVSGSFVTSTLFTIIVYHSCFNLPMI